MNLHIGVDKGQERCLRIDMLQADEQVVDLLATPLGCPGDDQRRPRAWGLRQDAASTTQAESAVDSRINSTS